MMHAKLAAIMLLGCTLGLSACTPPTTLESEQFADPVAGLEAQFAAVQADGQSPAPTRTARQRIAALRSLIAQARIARQIYSDPERNARATALLAEMQSVEAALVKATFAPDIQ
jgi:hypothetical protein